MNARRDEEELPFKEPVAVTCGKRLRKITTVLAVEVLRLQRVARLVEELLGGRTVPQPRFWQYRYAATHAEEQLVRATQPMHHQMCAIGVVVRQRTAQTSAE